MLKDRAWDYSGDDVEELVLLIAMLAKGVVSSSERYSKFGSVLSF